MKRFLPAVVVLLLPVAVSTASALEKGDPAVEGLSGVEVALDFVKAPDGSRLRTILTRPPDTRRKLPAILYLQDMDCESVRLPANGGDGAQRMLRALIESSGMVVARTERSGSGESTGPGCDELDYDTELAGHQAALAALRKSPFVDKDNIFLFGVGTGGTMAPLLARGADVRGIVVWGTTALSWVEHMILLDRRVLELRETDPDKVGARMRDHVRFHTMYLVEGRNPTDIFREDPGLRRTWEEMVGTGDRSHYGRPFRYHHQAAARNWERAWKDLELPVLVLRGQYDWMTSEAESRRIAEIIADYTKGTSTFVNVPETDHHFEVHSTPRAAFAAEQPGAWNAGVAGLVMDWINRMVEHQD